MDSHYPRVDLISSFDGGVTWNIEARRLQNTGTYQWTVPSVLTDQASLAVVVIHGENADLELEETGYGQLGREHDRKGASASAGKPF